MSGIQGSGSKARSVQSAREASRKAVKRYITGKAGVPPAAHGIVRRFHVVRIMRGGYHLLSSHADRGEAKKSLFEAGYRLGAVVLRDGNTGTRFSYAELRAEAA